MGEGAVAEEYMPRLDFDTTGNLRLKAYPENRDEKTKKGQFRDNLRKTKQRLRLEGVELVGISVR